MKTKLLKLKNFLFESFWFIPLLLIIFAVFLALVSLSLDEFIEKNNIIDIKDYLSGSIEGYRNILSMIGGSMMTIAGIVFSTTLVALTMTANQFGSKVLKNFIKDKLNQIVLGSYIATFTYCLIILRFVRPDKFISYTPDISIFIAMILGIGNIILLVFFIDKTAKSLQAENIILKIGNNLISKIRKILPNNNFNEKKLKSKESEIKKYNEKENILSKRYGYLEWVYIEELEKIAIENNIFIKIQKKVGDFILKGEKIGEFYFHKSKKNIKKQILNCIEVTEKKSALDDINFSMRQLVEIALRALSPGINAPHTAISCINIFTNAAGVVLEKSINTNLVYDEKQKLRLEINRFYFEDIINDSFAIIRQYSNSSPDVLKHLYFSIYSLIEVGDDENKHEIKVLKEELKNIRKTIKENTLLDNDFEYID